jgi:hypothetical protein
MSNAVYDLYVIELTVFSKCRFLKVFLGSIGYTDEIEVLGSPSSLASSSGEVISLGLLLLWR